MAQKSNDYILTKSKRGQQNKENQRNRLIFEKSPYLLQHAENPVDWYPWGAEAFAKARKEHKPIFLSIGYSTCHWCHVMAHESFEDPAVAQLINAAFVSIKVDREERPDLDNIYMQVCQMLTGSGGWPLTIIMTPDKKPFFAATYIPKETRYGGIGMLDLIARDLDVTTLRYQTVDDMVN
ncbi:MAG: thioredoxin domain-containing protein, partial [Proteobacteria bacterium]|nr:thioredoxin domain-containing protein [Pseudomonadota bacterium]